MIFCSLSEVLRSGTINSRNGDQMKIRIELMNLLQKEPPIFYNTGMKLTSQIYPFHRKILDGKMLFYLNYLIHLSFFFV